MNCFHPGRRRATRRTKSGTKARKRKVSMGTRIGNPTISRSGGRNRRNILIDRIVNEGATTTKIDADQEAARGAVDSIRIPDLSEKGPEDFPGRGPGIVPAGGLGVGAVDGGRIRIRIPSEICGRSWTDGAAAAGVTEIENPGLENKSSFFPAGNISSNFPESEWVPVSPKKTETKTATTNSKPKAVTSTAVVPLVPYEIPQPQPTAPPVPTYSTTYPAPVVRKSVKLHHEPESLCRKWSTSRC
ncbi:unnamed protein product [Nesidiocoris tenuis]|uniref:Uncharacterized protein n=1 Tax=Nesidiocoris tenuis TaxID=355587 RepID=A0A6H5HDZ4_9HEMI|nr:unnamed protein product [Nesidiocoris tenuis]